MGRGRSKAGGATGTTNSKGSSGGRLRSGETAYVSFSPTKLHPEGEPIIAKTADDSYRYMGKIPEWDDINVDKTSADYNRAKKDYDLTATFTPNGEVIVKKGGLYSRGKKFENINAFKKDAIQRIEAREKYDLADKNSLINGRISQIQAESYRKIVRENSSSMAIKKMNDDIKDNMQAVKARLEVAEFVKSRIPHLGEKANKARQEWIKKHKS